MEEIHRGMVHSCNDEVAHAGNILSLVSKRAEHQVSNLLTRPCPLVSNHMAFLRLSAARNPASVAPNVEGGM